MDASKNMEIKCKTCKKVFPIHTEKSLNAAFITYCLPYHDNCTRDDFEFVDL